MSKVEPPRFSLRPYNHATLLLSDCILVYSTYLHVLEMDPEGQEVYKRPNQKITSSFAQLPKRSKTVEKVSDVGALTAAAGDTDKPPQDGL